MADRSKNYEAVDEVSRARLQVAIGIATSEQPLSEEQAKVLHEICKLDPWVYRKLQFYIKDAKILVAAAQ